MFNVPKELVQKIIQYAGCFFYSVSSNILTDFRTLTNSIDMYRPKMEYVNLSSTFFMFPSYFWLTVIITITNDKQYFLEKHIYTISKKVEFFVGVQEVDPSRVGNPMILTSFYSLFD
jgi:hypothetical protein